MATSARALAILTVALCGFGCSNGDGSHTDEPAEDSTDALPEETVCDETRRPVLLVHGGFGGGDNYEPQGQRFRANGYCKEWIRAFDYDSPANLNGNTSAATLQEMDDVVEQMRSELGFDKIHLVGHSLGTSVCRNYLLQPENVEKIERLVHVAGGYDPAGTVPTLGLTSRGDKAVGLVEYPGAENLELPYLDHMEIISAESTFVEIYKYFNDGEAPQVTAIEPTDRIIVEGFVKNFADNTPREGIEVEVYEIDHLSGERISETPDHLLLVDAEGRFPAWEAEPDTYYEFMIPGGGEGGRDLHSYRQPFVATTHLVYLKAMPKPGSVGALFLGGLAPYTDDFMITVIQHTNRAIIAGDDSLTMDGIELSRPELTDEAATIVAIFVSDENGNGVSDGTPTARLAPAPYLTGADTAIPTDVDGPVEITLNDATLRIPRWRANSDGNVLVMFQDR